MVTKCFSLQLRHRTAMYKSARIQLIDFCYYLIKINKNLHYDILIL